VKLAVHPDVAAALAARRAVVALESTVIAHGLPRPQNLEAARALEEEVRGLGSTPATIAIADGQAVVGADDALLVRLAEDTRSRRSRFAISRRCSRAADWERRPSRRRWR
jgi:pseudouridine-5'-phosphate glycosidase